VLITTVPFGQTDATPLDRLHAAGVDVVVNPVGRRLTELELAELVGDVDVLIAGTEPITSTVMDRAPGLKMISRVGIGLDNVDLLAARDRGIQVCYTPDAPAPAVAELTIGLVLGLLRGIATADRQMRDGRWQRMLGRRLGVLTVGVVGVGRVGSRVISLLRPFGCRILANDLAPRPDLTGVGWVSKEQLFAESDVVTLHVPLTTATRYLVNAAALGAMRPSAVLVNTARGGIVDEAALAEALRSGRLAGAAIDVFEVEPYRGELAAIESCLLSCHMGSMSEDCRRRMEIEATENALAFLAGRVPPDPVPALEYELRQRAETCL
jgi:D-3-phosphoglycerate dehydrogenase